MTPPPTRDDCLACHRPFRENGELASAPLGRRFAFDPASRRVWRLCGHCGHWNLLGPGAAGAALPELEARFRTTAPGESPGIALVRPSDRLELLRLGERSDLTAQALALGDRQRKLQAAAVPAAIMLLLMLGLLLGTVVAGWRPGWNGAGRMAAMVGAIFGVHSWRRWRLGLRLRRGRTWFAVLATAVGTAIATLTDPLGLPQGIALSLGSALAIGFVSEGLTRLMVRYRLPSGRRLPVVQTELMALRLRWQADPAAVTVLLPDGAPLDAEDSRYVLTHLVEWIAGLPDDTLDQARTLVSTTPHLGDLLQLLPSGSDATGGDARIDDLPPVYWAALDLALSRERDAADQVEMVEEARRVAEIAEGLEG